VIVAVKKREAFLPIRSPVLVLIVNIQRSNHGILQRQVATSSSRKLKYQKSWEKDFTLMLIVNVYSVNCAKHMEKRPLNEQVVYGQQSHLPTGKKLLRR